MTIVPFDLPNVKNAVPGIHLIKHLLAHLETVFPVPNAKAIVTMSQSSSLIRTTVLALSATHLRCIAPSVVQHRVSEHFQQALALQQYQAVLYTPHDELNQDIANALLLSAILLNIVAFVLPASEGKQSAPGIDDEGTTWDLSWLAMQAGLRPLMKSISTYLQTGYSFLELLFLGGDRPDWGPEAVSKGLELVPTHWRQLFEIEDVAGDLIDCDGEITALAQRTGPEANRRRVDAEFYNAHGNHYRVPVFILALLKNIAVKPGQAFKNLQFLIKLHPDFRALLSRRDIRATYLYAYWLGLMCRYNGTWWSDQRVQRDYAAISSYLRTLRLTLRPGEEGILWTQMMQELDDVVKNEVRE